MWALQDVRLPTGAAADIVVEGDRIARLEAGAADGLAERIQCSGKLVLPGFIDGHVHLDKVLIRDELREHDGTLAGAIAAIHERKRQYTVEDVRTRARAVIEDSVRLGTTRLRSHVDVDTIGGLVPSEEGTFSADHCADRSAGASLCLPRGGRLRCRE